MSEVVIQSAQKAMRIFECLADGDFAGKTVLEICGDMRASQTTVWRLLKTMEAEGWVVELPRPGRKDGLWKISSKLSKVAHAYERHALAQMHQIEREFIEVTGRELSR
jgi:DNA-binding IclR family transcriptional regulator